MNSFSNRLTRADKLNIEIRSLMSKLSETTEKKKNYVKFDAINREKFDILHKKIEDTNIKLEILKDNIDRTSNRRRRSSRKKQMHVQRVIDDAKKKENALIKTLKKNRQKALEMEKIMHKTYQHLTKDKRIVNEINSLQADFSKLTTRGRGKKTKNRRIKKNQTKRRIKKNQTKRKIKKNQTKRKINKFKIFM